jgi:hypothetical protein
MRRVSNTGIGGLKVHLAVGMCVCRVWWNGEVADAFMATRSDTFLITNFRRVLNVVCFLLGNSLASEFYMPTFRNTLFHLHRRVGISSYLPAYEYGTDSVPKRWHIKFRCWGITQKKAYN